MKQAIILSATLFISACVGAFSANPRMATQQQWVAGCKAADSSISTATTLYKAGQLSESAADKIDDVVDLYEVICTNEPPDQSALAPMAIRILAAKVCPSFAPSNLDDWALTLVEAASCAAEGALLAEGSQ